MQTPVCLLAALLVELAFAHRIGFNFSANRNRSSIALPKEPEEYKEFTGANKVGWVEFADDGSDIKNDQLLEWIKKQTSGKETAEVSLPEDYTLSKSQEIGSWSHVIRQDEGKGSYSYGEGKGPLSSTLKQDSNNKGSISWTQVYLPEPKSIDSKVPNPWYYKTVSYEKFRGRPLQYASQESTSWPRGQTSTPKFQVNPKVEYKKKTNEAHWIWNHKQAKLEKVPSSPQQNKDNSPPRPNARPSVLTENPRSKAAAATPPKPGAQRPSPSSPQPNSPKTQAESQLQWKHRGVLRQHGKVELFTHEIPVPYEVKVEKEVRYPVHIAEERPVPYTVYKPYPVVVEKKVPFPVKVNVPYPVPVYKEVKVPVNVKEERLVPFDVHQTVPVYLEKTGLEPKPFNFKPKVPEKQAGGTQGSESVTETSADTQLSQPSKVKGSGEEKPPSPSYELVFEEEQVSDGQEKGWEELFTSQLSSIALPPQINGPYRTVEETQEEEEKQQYDG